MHTQRTFIACCFILRILAFCGQPTGVTASPVVGERFGSNVPAIGVENELRATGSSEYALFDQKNAINGPGKATVHVFKSSEIIVDVGEFYSAFVEQFWENDWFVVSRCETLRDSIVCQDLDHWGTIQTKNHKNKKNTKTNKKMIVLLDTLLVAVLLLFVLFWLVMIAIFLGFLVFRFVERLLNQRGQRPSSISPRRRRRVCFSGTVDVRLFHVRALEDQSACFPSAHSPAWCSSFAVGLDQVAADIKVPIRLGRGVIRQRTVKGQLHLSSLYPEEMESTAAAVEDRRERDKEHHQELRKRYKAFYNDESFDDEATIDDGDEVVPEEAEKSEDLQPPRPSKPVAGKASSKRDCSSGCRRSSRLKNKLVVDYRAERVIYSLA